MITDLWLPRLIFLGHFGIIVICGALIAVGHDSLITDLFIAGASSMLGISAYVKVTEK